MRTPDEAMPEPTDHGATLERFSQMESPDPNTFMQEAWPHLDPGQKELASAMLAPPVRRPEQAFGVAPESGGLARPEDKMYDSSDQLMKKALVGQPQAFWDLKNTKIDRPTDLSEVYGQKTSLGGYYHPNYESTGQNGAGSNPGDEELDTWDEGADDAPPPATGARLPSTVAVGRGNDLGMKDEVFWAGGDPVETARHELAHQINFEHPTYAKDYEQGFPALRDAVARDWASIRANPQLFSVSKELERFLAADDLPHVFTSLAAAYRKGAHLPPRIRSYLSSLAGESKDASEK